MKYLIVLLFLVLFLWIWAPEKKTTNPEEKRETCEEQFARSFPKSPPPKCDVRCVNSLFLVGCQTYKELMPTEIWAVNQALEGNLFLFFESIENSSSFDPVSSHLIKWIPPPDNVQGNRSFLAKIENLITPQFQTIFGLTDSFTKALILAMNLEM